MTDLQGAVLFTAMFAVFQLAIHFLPNTGRALRKRACFYTNDGNIAFYVDQFSTRQGKVDYAFAGMFGSIFSCRVDSQHMNILLDQLRTLRDDIDTGAYCVGNPDQTPWEKPKGSPLFGRKYTVLKRYWFINDISAENRQKYHNHLFDISICNDAAGHFALFELPPEPENVRRTRISLEDIKKGCDEVLGAFAEDFAEA
ncbi:hypothetical protein [Allorhizobium taibaishanense]|uniref:Uncharacterized protein n=1 Tax=Allorhizobium taibaishanense TaxID=887144 RepID=A0A1Q9A024_9HYPH|nr:hypothetical protein [Allorhizobium taibaishanense]MBB4007197.1 hypothetical protein [Allorhizobium taibaishanense]OLP47789.1 hypothetical protein BJF91_05360 [Allorhizobium taibaishanense]